MSLLSSVDSLQHQSLTSASRIISSTRRGFIKNPLLTSKQEERENLIKDRVTNLNDTRNREKRI